MTAAAFIDVAHAAVGEVHAPSQIGVELRSRPVEVVRYLNCAADCLPVRVIGEVFRVRAFVV